MEFDLSYFVQTALEGGRYDHSIINPCSNLAVRYGDNILKAARQYGYAEVEGLKIEVDGLDGFQTFFISGVEVTASRWQEQLLATLTDRFDKAYKCK